MVKSFNKALFTCLLLAAPALAVPISIVPDNVPDLVSPGNFFPFETLGATDMRVQQVSLSSAFSALGSGAFLQSFDFLTDESGFQTFFGGASVRVGSTAADPSNLSANQDLNASNPLLTATGPAGILLVPIVGDPDFNIRVLFANHFFYDPTLGENFLIDISVPNASDGPAVKIISIFQPTSSGSTLSSSNDAAQVTPGTIRVFRYNFDTNDAPEVDPGTATLPIAALFCGLALAADGQRRRAASATAG